ncbi:hypothetical protein ASD18_10355 [Cellulomonas sp. Root137]|nr:hypothetical protein ASD18_10355 [Cellulomonas sp. Root137]
MVTGGLRPPMQRVGLDDDDAQADDTVPSGPQRLRATSARLAAWAASRPVLAVVVAVITTAVLATVVIATPRWVNDRERAAVLGPAPFAEAVRVLGSVPQVRWSAEVDGSVVPVLAGDVVVAVSGTPSTARGLVGLDVVSGARRWAVALDAVPDPERVLCRPLDERLACVVGPVPPSDRGPDPQDETSTLLLVDPATGAVLARNEVPGWAVATAQAGSDLVVATYARGMLTVRRVDPSSGEARWETQRWSTFQSAGNGRVALVAAGGLVMAAGNDVTLLLDAATGERLPRPARGEDERLLDDGTLVRTRYRLPNAGVDAVSELSTGRGEPWLTVRGVLVEPGVSDGSSGLVFAASGLSGGPLGGRVRAYREGSAEAVWRALMPAPVVAVDAGGRVVLRGAGVLVGLEAATGDQLWRRDFGTSLGRTFTDGRHVVVEHDLVDGVPSLTAISLDDGGTAWRAPLPAGASRAVRLGTHLYALGDEVLVALR